MATSIYKSLNFPSRKRNIFTRKHKLWFFFQVFHSVSDHLSLLIHVRCLTCESSHFGLLWALHPRSQQNSWSLRRKNKKQNLNNILKKALFTNIYIPANIQWGTEEFHLHCGRSCILCWVFDPDLLWRIHSATKMLQRFSAVKDREDWDYLVWPTLYPKLFYSFLYPRAKPVVCVQLKHILRDSTTLGLRTSRLVWGLHEVVNPTSVGCFQWVIAYTVKQLSLIPNMNLFGSSFLPLILIIT